jgi:hypothetical protein
LLGHGAPDYPRALPEEKSMTIDRPIMGAPQGAISRIGWRDETTVARGRNGNDGTP